MRIEFQFKSAAGDYINGYAVGNDVDSRMVRIDSIENILNNVSIYPRFKIFILNSDETEKYEIPNYDIKKHSGNYSEEYQNGARRTISFSLVDTDSKYTLKEYKITYGTKIAFHIGMEIPEKDAIIWFRKGVFVVNKITPSLSSGEKTIGINAADKFSLFEGNNGIVPQTTKIEKGQKIIPIFFDILRQECGNGYVYDQNDIIFDKSFKDSLLPIDITMQTGQNWSSLLLQLAEILSAELFYDDVGRLNIVPIQDVVQDSDKPCVYSFSDIDGTTQSITLSTDLDKAVNKIYVVGATINGHTCMASSQNNSPDSPISIQKIGLKVGSIINDTNITSDYKAQERADYELRKQIVLQSQISIGAFLNPLLTVNNIIKVSNSYYGMQNDRFLIQSISIQIGYDGIMSISASNINNLRYTN